jgi:hypothetical protein
MGRFGPMARSILRGSIGKHDQCFAHQSQGRDQTRIAAMPSCTNRNQKIDFCVLQVTHGMTNGKLRRYASSRGFHGVHLGDGIWSH